MTIAQAVISFCIIWWLVLLIALPVGVRMVKNPEAGHAKSAPVRTNLRRKIKVVSLIALLLTLLAYSVANAQESMYQTRSGCERPLNYQPSEDIISKDSVTMHAHSIKKSLEYIDIPMEIPVTNYTDPASANADLSDTRIRPGVITVDTVRGEARFNGMNLNDPPLDISGCAGQKKSIYSTK